VASVVSNVGVDDDGGQVAVEPWEHLGAVGRDLFDRRFSAELVVGVADVETSFECPWALVEVYEHCLVHSLGGRIGAEAVFGLPEGFLDPLRKCLRDGLRYEAPVNVTEGEGADFVGFGSV
jgi:hypothetical protein